MFARSRIFLILSLACGLVLAGQFPVSANHCNAPPGLDDDYCHQTPPPQRTPTPRPPTPAPTPQPTAPPTAQPTRAPTPRPTSRTTPRPTRRSTPVPAPVATPGDTLSGTPTPTPFDDLDLEPAGTPEIVVQGPVLDEEDDTATLQTENTAAGGSAGWAFFLVGLIIGFLLRSLLPLFTGRKKKKQQIFG